MNFVIQVPLSIVLLTLSLQKRVHLVDHEGKWTALSNDAFKRILLGLSPDLKFLWGHTILFSIKLW